MPQPNYPHPDWANTGPPCQFVPPEIPGDWNRLLHVQTGAEALQTLAERCRDLERQQHTAAGHTLRVFATRLEQDSSRHSAALGSGVPPAQPTAETVAEAKRLLANSRALISKPNADAPEPDEWHHAVCQTFGGDALMTATGRRRDEYRAAGPEAAAVWRQAMDDLAHQCRHADAEFHHQAAQTGGGPGRRARRRLIAQANTACNSARHAYHEAVAGPRREMPVRYRPQA